MFLEILTRHFAQRPTLLQNNVASLADQIGDDCQQTILCDPIGMGIAWTHEVLSRYGSKLQGDYVWVLDDDDLCICPSLVRDLKAIVEEHGADAIVMRMDHGPRGVQPDNAHWQAQVVEGHIGCSGVVVERTLWQMCAHAWTSRYAGDFDFIAEVLDNAKRVYWHDCIASRVQCIGLGRPEKELL